MARVFLYGRNSGEAQEKAETIETQRKLLQDWAQKEQHEILGTYWDEGVESGIPVPEREEGGRLFRDLPRKKPDFVVCYKLSRWSRYPVVWHAGRNELRRHGADLLCLHDDTRDGNPGERFSLGVRLLVTEYERDNIEQTCLDGRYTWAADGYYSGGVVPYGYRPIPDPEGRTGKKVRTVLALDEAEAEVVRQIFHWCVRERLSCAAIARRLTAQGVPRATAVPDPERHRPYAGAPSIQWHQGTLRDILRAGYYKGCGIFGKTNCGRRDQISVAYLPIVDEALWQAAQAQLDRNRIMSPKNGKRNYLLRGLVHCPDCKRVLSGWSEERKGRLYIYYFCPGRKQPPHGRGHCPLPYIPARALEEDLWGTLVPLVKRREETIRRLRDEIRQGDRRRAGLRASCDGLRGAIEKKRLQLQRALDLATQAPPKIDWAEYEGLRARVSGEIDRLAEELSRQHGALSALEGQEERLEGVVDWLARFEEAVENPTPEGQRAVLEHLVERVDVTMEEGEPKVHYVFYLEPVAQSISEGVGIAAAKSSSGRRNSNGIRLTVPATLSLRRAA